MIHRRFFASLWIVLLITLLTSATSAQQYITPEDLADPNGDFVIANGVRLYYVTEGQATQPPVIFIHGFGGSTFTWRNTLAPVADAGFYAIALDLPPFGLSDKNPGLDYSRSGMADIVANFMDELGLADAVIVGHSMGGGVTAQFAVRHPDKVQKLVFVAGGVFDAASTPSDNDDTDERTSNSPLGLLNTIDPSAPAASILIRALVTRDFFVDSLQSAYYDATAVTDETIDGYARLLQIEDAAAGFLAYVQAGEDAPISLDDLTSAVTVPVQIIWGMEDTWVTIGVGETMANALPDAIFVRYDAVGHLPMEETPDQFNLDLLAFLQSN